jgi:integrase/recombinase XerD
VVKENSLAAHKLLLDRFRKYCEVKGVYFMEELNVDLLETFKAQGIPGADVSKATGVQKLRCFLREAFRRGWIKEPLVERVRAYQVGHEQKEPYTDAEIDKILAESCKTSKERKRGRYAKEPATFRLLLEFLLATGMRVGDAVLFTPGTLQRGEHLWIYTFSPQKQRRVAMKKTVEVFINDRLKIAIDSCRWLSPERPFGYGRLRSRTAEVWRRMQRIGKRCGIEDCRPHRLRDTFAIRRLLAGIALEDVSRLLGHSSVKVTESHYAKWTRSRKLRLERLLAESLVDA